ncbi:MAG: Transcription termination factor Rho, partial [uncultured Nocardioidaceae bacterium]
ARGGDRRHPRELRVRADQRLPPGPRRRLRLAVDGPEVLPPQGRRRHRRRPAAARGGAQGEVQPAGAAGDHQRRRRGGRAPPGGVQQADPALPERAAAARDREHQPHRTRHRHRLADRQGPARAHRLPGQGRQDDDHAVDRQLDHHEQPRVPPHGGPRRRAARGGHGLPALGQGRGDLLDLRPAGGRPHDRRRAGDRAREAAGGARARRGGAARRDHAAGPRLQPRGARERPDPLRWRGLGRALPAEEVLRGRAQHRGRRLADDPRHGAHRERLEDGRGDLRGVQGHRQHGDPAAPGLRRQAALPGDRRRAVRHPPRGAADEQGGAGDRLEAAPGPLGAGGPAGAGAPPRAAEEDAQQHRVPPPGAEDHPRARHQVRARAEGL